MNPHAKTYEFGMENAGSTRASAEAAVRIVANSVSETASDAAEKVNNETDDLVAWATKAIDENPGLAVAGAIAAGAVLACLMMPRRGAAESSISRLTQQAMDYGERLERRARRELKKIDADQAYKGVADFVSSYGSQIGGLMSGLMNQAQEFVEQARKR